MRTREKLTLEEKFALALELIKRDHSLNEIRQHYRVSHTTAYKIRNAFLDGGRAALSSERRARQERDLETRVRALEVVFENGSADGHRKPPSRVKLPDVAGSSEDGLVQERRFGK